MLIDLIHLIYSVKFNETHCVIWYLLYNKKKSEQHSRSSVTLVKLNADACEHISHLLLVFLFFSVLVFLVFLFFSVLMFRECSRIIGQHPEEQKKDT